MGDRAGDMTKEMKALSAEMEAIEAAQRKRMTYGELAETNPAYAKLRAKYLRMVYAQKDNQMPTGSMGVTVPPNSGSGANAPKEPQKPTKEQIVLKEQKHAIGPPVFGSKDQGPIQMPTTTPPNSSSPASPTGAMGTTSPPVTGDDTTHAEGPKGVVKPIAGLPDTKIKLETPSPPSGTPDKAGRRRLANDRPPDKPIGTVRDYAAAAGAKRP
jgi:hypothetical protein